MSIKGKKNASNQGGAFITRHFLSSGASSPASTSAESWNGNSGLSAAIASCSEINTVTLASTF